MNTTDGSQTPRQVIEQIRQGEYLLDVEASEAVLAGVRRLHKNLDRALNLLAEDLYSKQTHFVLELVQNAEDNDYLPGIVPKLSFRLSQDRLVASNNERGFTEDNVRALCRVGQSSKTKKEGYIGEKGIGFKSVFTVSDAPEIHSSGYHFRFDRAGANDRLGYVIPHWVESTDSTPENVTTIVLPAKPGTVFEDSMLADLDPKLLLFLSKLKELEIESPYLTQRYLRSDEGSITQLTSIVKRKAESEKTFTSRYVRAGFTLSMESVIEEKREGIVSTAFVLAFPIDESSKAAPEVGCPTFAFLPIRSFGFKFCLHADFLLSSSREDIITGRPWNIRLRDGIAGAFVLATETLKKTPALAKSFLKYLPAEGDISDSFFKSVTKQLIALMGKSRCILSATGEWKLPSEILLVAPKFRELCSPADARLLFGLNYPEAELEVDNATLERLGCKSLMIADIIKVFKNHSDWLAKQNKEWLAKFYAFVADLSRDILLKNGLLSVPCIPTSTNEFVVPQDVSVFYPLNNRKKYGFEQELVIIDTEITEMAISLSSKAQSLFDALGVKTDNPFELVRSYILPRHAGDAWIESGNEVLIGHLRYIKDKLKQYLTAGLEKGHSEVAAVTALREGLWLGTKQHEDGKWVFTRAANLYLSKEYLPTFCIETLLGEVVPPGSLISQEYLPKKAKSTDEQKRKDEANEWREFMLRLGVHETPNITTFVDGDAGCSSEFTALLQSPRAAVRKAVLECIDRNWTRYADHVTYRTTSRRQSLYSDTQFIKAVRSMQAPTHKKYSVSLSDSYLPTKEVHALFGESAVYVSAGLVCKGFLDACGITHSVDAYACIKRLRQLRTTGDETAPQLQNIYRQLERLWAEEKALISSSFNGEELIRVRKGERTIWASPEKVTWKSHGRFLDSRYPPLNGQYQDFSKFFVGKIGVAKDLPTEKMVYALLNIGEIEDVAERLKEALSIYTQASRELTPRAGAESEDEPDWLDTFRNQAVFMDRGGNLLENSELLYANDSPDVAELFSENDGIFIVGISNEQIPRVRRLLEKVNVKFLSTSIAVAVVDEERGIDDRKLTTKIRERAGSIARALYNSNVTRYEEARDKGLFAKLGDLEIVDVSEIMQRVRLGNIEKFTSGEIASVGDRILVRRGARAKIDRVAIEICKRLSAPDVFADTISRILLSEDAEAVDDFLRVKNISVLPEGEDAMFAPQDDSDSRGEIEGGESGEPELADHVREAESEDSHTASSIEQELGRESGEMPGAGEAQVGDTRPPTSEIGRRGADRTGTPGADSATAKSRTRQEDKVSGRVDGEEATIHAGATRDGTNESAELGDADSGPAGTTSVPSGRGSGSALRPSDAKSTHSPGVGANASARTKTKSGRWLSYAEAPDSEKGNKRDADEQRQTEQNVELGKLAVKFFVDTHRDQWRNLEPMEHNNPGYDVKAVSLDGVEEEIEVKGLTKAWTEEGISVTPTELVHAERLREHYWLCVVEFAKDKNRRKLYLLKNPFGLTQEFRFDSVWKLRAKLESANPFKPEAGLSIEIPGVGNGEIISAKRQGVFFKLHVQLENGQQVFKQFNPATMKLSRK